MLTEKRKRRGPKPTGKGYTVGVRLQPEMIRKIDDRGARQNPPPSRPEAIRQILAASFKLVDEQQ